MILRFETFLSDTISNGRRYAYIVIGWKRRELLLWMRETEEKKGAIEKIGRAHV